MAVENEQYQVFVRMFLRKFRAQIINRLRKIVVPSRFDEEDVLQYIGAKIIEKLRQRANSNEPIRKPVQYFKQCIGFYCAEYRRMCGYTVCLPARPRIPKGPDETEAINAQYVYFSTFKSIDSLEEPSNKNIESDSPLVHACLNICNPMEATAVRMMVLQGLDSKDIADILGCSTMAATRAATAGLLKIREYLEKCPDLPEHIKALLGLKENGHE